MLVYSAIFLAATVLAVPLFKRLGLGSVLGYLAAGALIGPSGLGLIREVEATLHFAEFGVVLLLFLIGLELQPSRLWAMRGRVFGLGGLQVVLTGLPIAGIALALGADRNTALVAGLGLALSSTAFATQVLGERNEFATAHGQSAFGILLFQDLAAIPALAFVPVLAAGAARGPEPGGPPAGAAALVLVALVLAGRFLLRPLLRFVAQARSHELSVASALLVVIATSLLMEQVQLSMALGAFMAGVLLADSEYRHDLEANLEPFKGLLLGLFFIAVGMAANLRLVAERPILVGGLVLLLVTLKGAVLYGLARGSRLPAGGAASLAVSISQGGEFAFVLFGLARTHGVMARPVEELLVVVVTLSMATTPLLFIAKDAIARRLAKSGDVRAFDRIADEGNPVIIAGFGRFGQIVGRVLQLKHVRFTALDASATHVDFVRRFGNEIYYGDASRPELLRAAGAAKARLFVLAIDDPEASMRTLELVRREFPHLTVVARARNRSHAYALHCAGVQHVLRETFLSSTETARVVLEELGLTGAEARDAVRIFSEYDEEAVRRMAALRDDEAALIAGAKEYGKQLERIFEEDQKA